MIKKSLPVLIICAFLVTNCLEVKAHGGRTDEYGCHNCRTGACAGEYHCHGGGYVAPRIQLQPVETPNVQPDPIIPKNQLQEIKSINNNLEKNNITRETLNKAEKEEEKSNTADNFVILVSLLVTLALGYFFYNIFNKS